MCRTLGPRSPSPRSRPAWCCTSGNGPGPSLGRPDGVGRHRRAAPARPAPAPAAPPSSLLRPSPRRRRSAPPPHAKNPAGRPRAATSPATGRAEGPLATRLLVSPPCLPPFSPLSPGASISLRSWRSAPSTAGAAPYPASPSANRRRAPGRASKQRPARS